MRCIASRILLAAGILLSLTYGAYAGPPTDIQMLPPIDFGGATCSGSNGGLLYWDGTSPIRCIPNSSGDSSSNVHIGNDLTVAGTISTGSLSASNSITSSTGTIGNLTVNGSGTGLSVIGGAYVGNLQIFGETLGALTGVNSDVLVELTDAPVCAVNQALVKNSGGFGCVNIIDLSDIGTFPIPACGAGSALTWTGSGGFACVAVPAPTPPASAGCASGFMTGISGGTTASCGIAAAANVSCTAGMYVTGVDSSGNPICSTPPSGLGAPCTTPPMAPTVGVYLQGAAVPAQDGYSTVWMPLCGSPTIATQGEYQCQNGAWQVIILPTCSTAP